VVFGDLDRRFAAGECGLTAEFSPVYKVRLVSAAPARGGRPAVIPEAMEERVLAVFTKEAAARGARLPSILGDSRDVLVARRLLEPTPAGSVLERDVSHVE
jgi:hypothetical protein